MGIRLIFTGWSIAMLGAMGEAISDELGTLVTDQMPGRSPDLANDAAKESANLYGGRLLAKYPKTKGTP